MPAVIVIVLLLLHCLGRFAAMLDSLNYRLRVVNCIITCRMVSTLNNVRLLDVGCIQCTVLFPFALTRVRHFTAVVFNMRFVTPKRL